MAARTAKFNFEFTISQLDSLRGAVYTPPFATSADTSWQIKFELSPPEHSQYCSLFLCAVPSAEEENNPSAWGKRHKLSAMLWVKDADGPFGWKNLVDPVELKMGSYSKERPVWGFSKFCRKSILTPEIIVGVSLADATLSTDRINTPLARQGLPTDLVEAWEADLNNSEIADVQFNVRGRPIFARSSILRRRSDYFDRLFQEEEFAIGSRLQQQRRRAVAAGHRHTDSLTSRDGDIESLASMDSLSLHKYVIDVPDFEPETFIEMLRFLYSSRVFYDEHEDSGRTVFDMMLIADRYRLPDLRRLTNVELAKHLKKGNVADMLAQIVWRVPSYKEEMIDLVLKMFPQAKARTILERINKIVTRKKQQKALVEIGQKSYRKYVDYCRMQMVDCEDNSDVKEWAQRTVDAQVIYSLVDSNDDWWKRVCGMSLAEAQPIIDEFEKQKKSRKKVTDKTSTKSAKAVTDDGRIRKERTLSDSRGEYAAIAPKTLDEWIETSSHAPPPQVDNVLDDDGFGPLPPSSRWSDPRGDRIVRSHQSSSVASSPRSSSIARSSSRSASVTRTPRSTSIERGGNSRVPSRAPSRASNDRASRAPSRAPSRASISQRGPTSDGALSRSLSQSSHAHGSANSTSGNGNQYNSYELPRSPDTTDFGTESRYYRDRHQESYNQYRYERYSSLSYGKYEHDVA